jgi:hypothetical protein
MTQIQIASSLVSAYISETGVEREVIEEDFRQIAKGFGMEWDLRGEEKIKKQTLKSAFLLF